MLDTMRGSSNEFKKSNYSVCSTVHYKMMNYKVMYELVADRTGSLYGDTGGCLVVLRDEICQTPPDFQAKDFTH